MAAGDDAPRENDRLGVRERDKNDRGQRIYRRSRMQEGNVHAAKTPGVGTPSRALSFVSGANRP
jgi:hypothetical protein